MNPKKKILFVFGTRPEAIKMAPLIKAMKADDAFDVYVCITAQHRQMLDQVLDFFHIKPNFDLNLMKPDQSLSELTANILVTLPTVFTEVHPEAVFVQGDTTTALTGAISAFYHKIPVGHVEAGLRTKNRYSPFPEEVNRRLISSIAEMNFAPTQKACQNLRNEDIDAGTIFFTGNTVVDALQDGLSILNNDKVLLSGIEEWFIAEIAAAEKILQGKSRLVLITGHRRENFGDRFESICNAIAKLSEKFPDDTFIYPVHLNPNVQKPVYRILGAHKNVFLIDPVDYPKMLFLLSKTVLILTDSGGIQEEAPTLKIPVLILRDDTERPELVDLGGSLLVGSRENDIIKNASALLNDKMLYSSMQVDHNPYGDGMASIRIMDALKQKIFRS
jgi:UDP-N-acetylglucosamine 2-epimerase (non-hydrolysing)